MTGFSSLLAALLVFVVSVSARKSARQLPRPAPDANGCRDPPDLKEKLAEWLSEAAEGDPNQDWKPLAESDDDWSPPVGTQRICDSPPDTSTDSSVMARSLCPWTWRVSYDDSREPRLLSEATCLCRRSRGSSASYCMPIKRQTPVLRRGRCVNGYYEYSRALISTTVGCHSVLPRTQRAVKLGKIDVPV